MKESTSNNWKIIFKGEILENFDIALVKQDCINTFKFPPQKIELLFSGKEITLKKELTKEDAVKYATLFRRKGLRIIVSQTQPKPLPQKAKMTLSLVEEPDREPLKASSEDTQNDTNDTGLSLSLENAPKPVKIEEPAENDDENEKTTNNQAFTEKSLSEKIELINDEDKVDERPPLFAFNVEGRIDPISYLLRIVLLSFSMMLLDILSIAFIAALFFTIPCYLAIIRTNILRLHDMNLSGYWALIFPIVNIILSFATMSSGFDSSITLHYLMLSMIYSVTPWLSLTLASAIINIAWLAFMMIKAGTVGANDYGSPVVEENLEQSKLSPTIIGIISTIVLVFGMLMLKPAPANSVTNAPLKVVELNSAKLHTGDFITFDAYVVWNPGATQPSLEINKHSEENTQEENYSDDESEYADSSDDSLYSTPLDDYSNAFGVVLSDKAQRDIPIQSLYEILTSRNKAGNQEYFVIDEKLDNLQIGKKYRFKLYVINNGFKRLKISQKVESI